MRKVLMVVLGLGALGGFAAGFAHLRHHAWHHHRFGDGMSRRERFEEHVADICVRAAEKRLEEGASTSKNDALASPKETYATAPAPDWL